jgi:hypothetical protein
MVIAHPGAHRTYKNVSEKCLAGAVKAFLLDDKTPLCDNAKGLLPKDDGIARVNWAVACMAEQRLTRSQQGVPLLHTPTPANPGLLERYPQVPWWPHWVQSSQPYPARPRRRNGLE